MLYLLLAGGAFFIMSRSGSGKNTSSGGGGSGSSGQSNDGQGMQKIVSEPLKTAPIVATEKNQPQTQAVLTTEFKPAPVETKPPAPITDFIEPKTKPQPARPTQPVYEDPVKPPVVFVAPKLLPSQLPVQFVSPLPALPQAVLKPISTSVTSKAFTAPTTMLTRTLAPSAVTPSAAKIKFGWLENSEREFAWLRKHGR